MLSAGAITADAVTCLFVTPPTRHPSYNVHKKGPGCQHILDTNGTERHLAQDRAATNTRNPRMCDKLGGIARAVGPTYTSGAAFATVSVRAPAAPKGEQLASNAIRDAFLHPRRSRIERKMVPATLVRCGFHVGNQANP